MIQEGEMEISVAIKGRDCVELAKRVATELEDGTVVHSSSNLQKLQETGTEIAKHTEELAKRLTKVQKFNIKQEGKIRRQIGDYERQESVKQQQINNAQSSLDANNRILSENHNNLTSAQGDLSSAENRLRNKKREAENAQIGTAVGGAILGVFTAGIGGLLFGATAGAIIGQAIKDLVIEVDAARRTVGRREQDCRNAQASVEASERQISDLRSQLSSLINQKEQLERQRCQYHDKATQLKDEICILQEAVTFWQMFKQLSDSGTNRTTLLKKIVEKAESEANPGFLSSKPTQRLAGTVLDVWAEMESTAEQGSTDYAFSMEYTCLKCKETQNNLPYILEEECVCTACYRNAITD